MKTKILSIVLIGISLFTEAQTNHLDGQTKLINPTGRSLLIEKDDDDSWLTFHDPGDRWYSLGIDKSNSGAFIINYGGDLSKSEFVMRTDGKIGMGVANPSAKLEVSDIPNNASIVLSNDNLIGFKRSDGALVYGIGHTNGEFNIGSTANLGPTAGTPLNIATGGAHIRFSQGGEERIRIKSNGRVGIGTTNPLEKLDVNGNIMLQGYSGSNDGGLGALKFFNNYLSSNSVLAQIQARRGQSNYQKGDLAFYVKDGVNMLERMRVVSSGNVGIGTSVPDAKLAVKGNIHTNEVKVDLLGAVAPDYVFYKDYDLKTLKEVERYIAKKGHLPNIPSAKEMEANGILLKEMNLKLLEKIEELTLYTIDQEKRIESLEVKNEKLMVLVEKLLKTKIEK